MPIKSPGGYQLIDMKGSTFGLSLETISDPNICDILLEILEEGANKPVYITNFAIEGIQEPVGTLPLDTWSRGSHLLFSNIFNSDGTPNITLTIDLADLETDHVAYIQKVEN